MRAESISNRRFPVKRSVVVLSLIVVSLFAASMVFASGQKEGAAPAKASSATELGIAIRTLTNPYQANYKVGAEMFAKTVGLNAVVLTCEGSSEKQVNDIKSLVAKTGGDVVFFIDPNEATDCVAISKALDDAGVYFVTWWNKPEDLKVWDSKYWVAHISYDGLSAGEFMATELFKTFKTPNKGKFIALQGMLANSIAQDRFKGMQNAVKANPGVKLVAYEAADWDRSKAYEKTKNLLVANPDIEGVWAANDNMALGALEALRDAGLAGKVKVVGCDGVDEMFDAIKKGEAAATVYNDAKYQAGIGLSIALAAKNGKIDVASLPKKNRQFFAGAVNVNAANVDEILATYVNGTPKYDYSDYFGGFVRVME